MLGNRASFAYALTSLVLLANNDAATETETNSLAVKFLFNDDGTKQQALASKIGSLGPHDGLREVDEASELNELAHHHELEAYSGIVKRALWQRHLSNHDPAPQTLLASSSGSTNHPTTTAHHPPVDLD